MKKNLDYKLKLATLKKQSEIGRSCLNNGYAIVKLKNGKYYKIRELG